MDNPNTETVYEPYGELDTWTLNESLTNIVESNRRALKAVAAALPALERSAKGVERALKGGGRLVYIGAGTSGRLALQDAAELLPTFGFDRTVVLLAGGEGAGAVAAEGAEDDAAAAERAVDEAGIGADDAVVGLAASGRTPYTVAGVRRARERGAFTVGIANNGDTPLLEVAECEVCLNTGPEVLAGSTRLAAGTAQKVVLNALSTAVLVRLGGAYRNLMVGMQPSNAKLRARAVSIVSGATHRSEEEAEATLEAADWKIRESIVMLQMGSSFDQAAARLEEHGGSVRDVLSLLAVE